MFRPSRKTSLADQPPLTGARSDLAQAWMLVKAALRKDPVGNIITPLLGLLAAEGILFAWGDSADYEFAMYAMGCVAIVLLGFLSGFLTNIGNPNMVAPQYRHLPISQKTLVGSILCENVLQTAVWLIPSISLFFLNHVELRRFLWVIPLAWMFGHSLLVASLIFRGLLRVYWKKSEDGFLVIGLILLLPVYPFVTAWIRRMGGASGMSEITPPSLPAWIALAALIGIGWLAAFAAADTPRSPQFPSGPLEAIKTVEPPPLLTRMDLSDGNPGYDGGLGAILRLFRFYLASGPLALLILLSGQLSPGETSGLIDFFLWIPMLVYLAVFMWRYVRSVEQPGGSRLCLLQMLPVESKWMAVAGGSISACLGFFLTVLFAQITDFRMPLRAMGITWLVIAATLALVMVCVFGMFSPINLRNFSPSRRGRLIVGEGLVPWIAVGLLVGAVAVPTWLSFGSEAVPEWTGLLFILSFLYSVWAMKWVWERG